MFSHLKNFLRDESGPTAVEYAVMLALIVAVCIGAVNTMAGAAADSFDTSAAEIASVMGS
jgi:pilus assembly protein Flp/PilA